MPDPTFEARLAIQLDAYAEGGVRPIDRHAVAKATIVAGADNSLGVRLGAIRPLGPLRGLQVAFIVVLLAALAFGVALVGSRLLDRRPQAETPEQPAVVAPTADLSDLTYRGVFEPTGPLDPSLAVDAFVRLSDGRVLGMGDSWPERKQQALWDPVTGRFSPAGLLAGKRSQPIGVLMRDGRVLILGGDIDPAASSATYSTAEIYDPVTGAFAAAGPMVGRGWAPSAIRLADGRVLVLDGISVDDAYAPNPLLATAEIYDPVTDTFTATGPMSVARGPASMALLEDGRVLVVGRSWDDQGVVDLFDPVNERFAPTAKLPPVGPHPQGGTYWPQAPAGAVRLADGRILVPGRGCVEEQSITEGRYPTATAIFDPATETFSVSSPMPHCVETATSLPNGRVFLTAFWGSTNWSGIYDPSTGAVTETAAPPAGRYMDVVGLADGGVLVVGGGVAKIFR